MRNEDPLVSVVMPNYNGADFLERSISSVIGQSYSNWELIVCDDASTDDSLQVIQGFHDERILAPICLSSNQGAAVARNKAIRKAGGPLIAFLDNDDYWAPDKLRKQVTFMLENGYDFTYTDYYRVAGPDKKYIKCKMQVEFSDLLRNNYILTSTVMFNAARLGKVYMEDIRKRQDWSLFINIVKKSGTGYNLDEPLTYYRKHGGSLSSNKLNLIKYNFNFYHQVLGYPKLKSVFLMIRFLFYYFLKKITERL